MSPARDDDLLPGLPALDGGDDDGAPLVGLEDDDADESVDESVGLDTEVGTGEDVADDLEGDESESWTNGADDAADLEEGEEDFGAEDSGWTDDATSAVEEDEVDLDEPESASLVSDRGEEGLDEEPSREGGDDELDAPRSGAVSAEADAADEDDDDRTFGEESVSAWGDDEPEVTRRAVFALDATVTLRVRHLGPTDDATASVATDGRRVFAGGASGLYQAGDGGPLSLCAEERDGEGVTSVVLDPSEGHCIAFGTRLAGVRVSRDGGITFDSTNGWQRHAGDVEVALFVAGEPTERGLRLWARTRSGALYRSDDFGASWSAPVLLAGVRAFAVGADGGGVTAVVASRGAVHVARSRDGGARWSMRAAPLDPRLALAGDGELALATLGDVLVLAHPADPAGLHLSTDDGATWTSDPSLRGACALALAREGESAVVYAGIFSPGVDHGVVVRRGSGGHASLILDVAAERRVRALDALGDPDGDQRIFALEARVDAGTTRIFAATAAGLFRIDRSPNGS